MSDLLEALKDTNRLIEAILMMQPGHNHSETLKETSTRAQLLTERIIEASRQAGAAGVPSIVLGSAYEADLEQRRNMEYLRRTVSAAMSELVAVPSGARTMGIERAILHLKAGIEGGAA